MKKKLYKVALILSLAVTTSCTDNFVEYNTNPNKMPQGSISPSATIEPVIYTGTNNLSSYMLSIANEISQITVAKSSPRQEHCYNLGNGNFLNIWNLTFNWAGRAKHMYDLASEQNQPNYQAIGQTLKVYYLSICTDMFGSIAYSEALKGDEGIKRPKIESQRDVYLGMMNDLEEANALYNQLLKMDDPSKDGIYGGDIEKWQKFTNTLHLRLLMRVSGRDNDFSPTVGERISKIINNPSQYPIFDSAGDDATVKFSGTTEYYKTHFNFISFPDDKSLSGDHHVSSQFLNMIYNESTGFSDPRMKIWIKPRYTSTEIREMVGAPSGATTTYNSNTQRSEKEPFLHYETLVNDVNPNILLCYDELLFIKAEAALNGWIGGSAREYYEAAITASCQRWGGYGANAAYPEMVNGAVATNPVYIEQKDIDAFLQSEEARWDGSARRLAEQKWLSLFWVLGFQQYHEMRRTGYPECKIGMGAINLNYTNGNFIARYAYPLIAIANNRANYEAAFNEQGATVDDNNMILPVWWSGQAVAKDMGSPWEHSFRKRVIATED